jgi:hypothetical protein
MFGLFKKLIRTTPTEQTLNPMYDFKWYEIGEGNPFNKRVLDVRAFTQQMTSATKDPLIATQFVTSRASMGEEYNGFEITNCISVDTELVYPHDGRKIEGVGYKGKEMEDKWDIYAWDNIIYFVRSWSAVVRYKAFITYNDDSFTVSKIQFVSPDDESSIAINNVHFLISTLLFNKILPHKLPQRLSRNEDIAQYSFSAFGRNCWYATYDDIIDTEVKLQGS